MAPIKDATEEIESHGSGGGWSYRKIAKKYGVARESLKRLHQGINAPMEEQKLQRRKLNSQQEAELVS
jgi:transposase